MRLKNELYLVSIGSVVSAMCVVSLYTGLWTCEQTLGNYFHCVEQHGWTHNQLVANIR